MHTRSDTDMRGETSSSRRAGRTRSADSRAERERSVRRATRSTRKPRRSVGADVLSFPLSVGSIDSKRNLSPHGRGMTVRLVQEQRTEEGIPIRPAVYTQRKVGLRGRLHIARRWGTGLGVDVWKIVLVGLLILALALVAVFGPLKDYYNAWRNAGVLQVEHTVLTTINEGLTSDVERLNTLEGIEDEARRRGYVYPGEEAVVVEGLDEKSLSEQEALDQALEEYEQSLPWYVHTLDNILGYSRE